MLLFLKDWWKFIQINQYYGFNYLGEGNFHLVDKYFDLPCISLISEHTSLSNSITGFTLLVTALLTKAQFTEAIYRPKVR